MDFDQSHKTFKRMMPTFAWEVIEVYSGTFCPRIYVSNRGYMFLIEDVFAKTKQTKDTIAHILSTNSLF